MIERSARLALAAAFLCGAALPAGAIEYASGQFARECKTRVPAASCSCIIGQLSANRDGRFMLEAYELVVLNAEQRREPLLDLLNRYGMKASDAQNAIDRLRSSFPALAKSCQ